jgi:hypothetical protein
MHNPPYFFLWCYAPGSEQKMLRTRVRSRRTVSAVIAVIVALFGRNQLTSTAACCFSLRFCPACCFSLEFRRNWNRDD